MHVIRSLDEIFRPIRDTIDDQFESLFVLQALARIALTVHRFAIVAKSIDESSNDGSILIRHSCEIAAGVLARIRVIFESPRYRSFELDPPTRPRFEDYLRACINRGPPSLSRYFFLYGLLDCAAQLARILPPFRMEPGFGDRMIRIVGSRREPSFRWKAVSHSGLSIVSLETYPSA